MRHIIFGESHGPAVGVVLEGVPAGVELDLGLIQTDLARRAGGGELSTARKEADQVRVLSGVFEGRTTGTPLCMVIENGDVRSGDYEKTRDLMRPSHADYTGRVRYGGWADYRGGGHFSGRLTAPLVAAGAVAKLALWERGIFVGAHIKEIAGIYDSKIDCVNGKLDRMALKAVMSKPFPVFSDDRGREMQDAILAAKKSGDSVGGCVECAVLGLPAGLGAPDHGRNVEGIFAQQLFAVPAVKSVGFGIGRGFATLRGSEANDPFYMDGDQVKTLTNHSGGVNGGITNGMPVVCSVTIRPTPSIAMEQDTVDLAAGENAKLSIQGRHDPCIVHRAVPAIEAACALAACQLMGI